MKTLSEIIRQIAIEEVGVSEVGNTNTSSRVREYQASTNLDGTGWPWCSAFVCWVVMQAMIRHGGKFTFARPTTAAAYGFDEWSLAQDNSTKTRRSHGGDEIAIFSLKSVSHCGIAISKPDKNGVFRTIEGNSNSAGSRTGGMVVYQRRHISNVRDWVTFTV